MSNLVAPHGGGELRPLLVTGSEQKAGLERAEGLKIVPMSSRETSDLVMLAMGAYTPLEGFMGHADWHSVCLDMRLSDGLFWPIPITLSCEADLAAGFAVGEEVALVDNETCAVMGTLHVTEKYAIDKSLECTSVFCAADEAHPGVATVHRVGHQDLLPIGALGDGLAVGVRMHSPIRREAGGGYGDGRLLSESLHRVENPDLRLELPRDR